jgi:hypothetical protein
MGRSHIVPSLPQPSNYADPSLLFTILTGEKTNEHLGMEYLAVLETDNNTPYFLNLHTRDVAHTLILGMTGSGKMFLRKYAPQRLPPKRTELSLPARVVSLKKAIAPSRR